MDCIAVAGPVDFAPADIVPDTALAPAPDPEHTESLASTLVQPDASIAFDTRTADSKAVVGCPNCRMRFEVSEEIVLECASAD